MSSALDLLRSKPPQVREAALRALTDDEAHALLWDWSFWARDDQLPPAGEWLVWMAMSGRGWGKTRVGAEYIRAYLRAHPKHRAALVARTLDEVRTTMVEGESGLLSVLSPEEREGIQWNRTTCEMFFANGSQARGYTAEKPEKLRGPQHHVAWADEVAQWKDARLGIQADTTWSNLMLGLRLGTDARCVVTTTPKPFLLIKQLLVEPGTVVTRGSTYDNLANLTPTFRARILRQFEGTRLGRQELHAEILEDVEGALWTRLMIEQGRLDPDEWEAAPRDLVRVGVAIDPAVSVSEGSAETGIIVGGADRQGDGYVLADYSGRMTPLEWARRAVNAYEQHHADCIIAEVNNGGDLVAANIRTVSATVPIETVHAARGKAVRAQPISSLSEQARIHHIGMFAQLEDQLCGWVPDSGDPSPDRLDALVWLQSWAMVPAKPEPFWYTPVGVAASAVQDTA